MKRLSKLLWWFNIGVAIITLLSYLAPYINPQKIWQASFLGLAYPTLLWINLIFIVVWSMARKKYAFLSLLVIILGWSALRSLVGMNFDNAATVDKASTFRILTYNTNALYGLNDPNSKPNQNALRSSFKNFVEEQQANIICFQEFPGSKRYLFEDSTRFGQYNQLITPIASIFSTWPILDSESAYFPKSSNGYLWADVKTSFDTIRIFNIHLQSNSISKTTDKVQVTDLAEQETWSTFRGLLARVNEQTLKRVDQAEMISEMMSQSPHPVILTGDFNNTPQSYSFKLLSTGLIDSFRAKGFGLGTTYAGKIPNLRIDFILVDQLFEVVASEVPQVEFSDHYPVVSTFTQRP